MPFSNAVLLNAVCCAVEPHKTSKTSRTRPESKSVCGETPACGTSPADLRVAEFLLVIRELVQSLNGGRKQSGGAFINFQLLQIFTSDTQSQHVSRAAGKISQNSFPLKMQRKRYISQIPHEFVINSGWLCFPFPSLTSSVTFFKCSCTETRLLCIYKNELLFIKNTRAAQMVRQIWIQNGQKILKITKNPESLGRFALKAAMSDFDQREKSCHDSLI